MVHPDILEKTGTTQARLREVFCCKKSDSKNWKIKERLTDLVRSRVHEGNISLMQESLLVSLGGLGLGQPTNK
jgi:hypothetical protein